MRIMYAVEEAIMTQCPPRCCVQPQGLLLFLSTSRYYGAACRGSQYTGRRWGRTAAVNQRSEVAGTNRSEPSSAGTCPFPQLAPPRHYTVPLGFPPPEERGSLVPQSASLSCKPPHKATNVAHLHSTSSGPSAWVFTRLFLQPERRRDTFDRLRSKSVWFQHVMEKRPHLFWSFTVLALSSWCWKTERVRHLISVWMLN